MDFKRLLELIHEYGQLQYNTGWNARGSALDAPPEMYEEIKAAYAGVVERLVEYAEIH